MNSEFNAVLEGIRDKIIGDMEFDSSKEALGEAATDRHGSLPGTGKATNITGVTHDFDRYIEDIVDAIGVEYGLTVDGAMQCVGTAIDQMIEEALLFEIPNDQKGLAIWIARAATCGLGERALSIARSQVNAGA